MIALGSAYAKLGDYIPIWLVSGVVQNLGGAYLLANIKIAREVKLVEITNPTVNFVQNLWSLQDKYPFFKNFMKATMVSVKTNTKIYIPFLL